MKVRLIHLPILVLGLIGYLVAGYIFLLSVENDEFVQYIYLAILPFVYAFGTIFINRHDISVEDSPVRYIADVIFFVKLVVVPFVFYMGNCELGEYSSRLKDYFIQAVLLELSQYLITIVALKNIHFNPERSNVFSFCFSRNFTKNLIRLMILVFVVLCVIRREFITDYFSFFDYQKNENEMMQMHGALYAIFTFLAQIAYLVVPLFIVAWINKKFRRMGFWFSMPVLLLPFIISTVNHFYALIIDISIISYLYVKYENRRKYIVVIAILGLFGLIPMVSFKATSTMLMFLNSYIQGFVNDAGMFVPSQMSRLYRVTVIVLKSIPFIAGFFKGLVSDDTFTYALFMQEGRNDQFPSMVGQLIYYFGPLYPVMYYFMLRFLKRLEALISTKQSDVHNLIGFMLMYNFCYIVFAGNLNSFITLFFIMLIVMLGVNGLSDKKFGEGESPL